MNKGENDLNITEDNELNYLSYKYWAFGIASTILYCLEEVKLRNPSLADNEQFYYAIVSRPNVSDKMAIKIISEALSLEGKSPQNGNVLRNICYLVCRFDHNIRLKKGEIPKIRSGLCATANSGSPKTISHLHRQQFLWKRSQLLPRANRSA